MVERPATTTKEQLPPLILQPWQGRSQEASELMGLGQPFMPAIDGERLR
jgi:hypothetical protein